MTPCEAAEIIGCSARHLRYLITAGKLRAKKTEGGCYYYINARDVRRYSAIPQTVGYPRGKPRGAK